MKERTGYHIVYSIARAVLSPVYWLRVEGGEDIPEGAAIICANHSSALDPLLVSFAFGRNCFMRHMAKMEIRRTPVVGWVLEKCGSIFVRRDQKDIDSVRRCMKALAGGEKLMIFPEGTRVKDGQSVEAKNGAVYMAARRQVPIIPVYVPREKKPFHTLTVRIGKPYLADGGRDADMDALSRDLMERIEALGCRT